ncbi:MAG TPA: hypothetical protein PK047_12080 [Saprospiraceae bacterium]|nr:hypothetical protein [Saprospiraceae bacterium]
MNTKGCNLSTSDYNEILAIAMNSAVAIAQERISKGQPIWGNTSNPYGMQFATLYKEQIEIVAGINGCSQLIATPILSNVTRDEHATGWDSHCGEIL